MTICAVILTAVIVFLIVLFYPDSADKNQKKTSADKTTTTSEPSETVVPRPETVTEIFPIKNKFEKFDFQKLTFNDKLNGNMLPYRLYIPDDYKASEKYPVILFLHGAGEIGNDNVTQMSNISKMFELNGDLVSQAIIICPQSYEWWNLDRQYAGDQGGTLGSVLHLLTDIKGKYSFDNNRIYVTGLSMGGYATWNLLSEYGDIFAAGIPICGGGNSGAAHKLKDIPIRIYHSRDDNTVSFSASQTMYNAIKNAGGKKVEFIELNGLGHNSWDYAYSDREAICWMLAQNKATNPTGKYEVIPYFRVVDENGETIISYYDIIDANIYSRYNEGRKVIVDLTIDSVAKNKLKNVYETNPLNEFTVYWSFQKVCTFTLSSEPIDDKLSLAGVFDVETAKAFCDTII